MKIASIYRTCGLETGDLPKNEVRPNWFSKFDCFINYYNNIGNSGGISNFFVWDGDEMPLLKTMKQTIKKEDTIIKLNVKSNKESLIYCYNLAAELIDKFDAFYFVEDDYLHLPGACNVLIQGLKNFDLLSLYDHPDRYFQGHTDITNWCEKIFLTDFTHWRTAESTTGTVAMTSRAFKILQEDLFCFNVNDRPFYRYIFTHKGVRLVTPIPGYATHVNKYFMSPLVNWKELVTKC